MKTILLVDDEALIRAIVTKVLSRAGHTLIQAGDGATAIREGEERKGSIDLLLTDLELPDIRGPEIFEKLKANNPDMRVLFMSGFGAADLQRSGPTVSENFLQKPFSLTQLEQAVEKALE